jgi:nucleotide-binding universal stress UspA family protein
MLKISKILLPVDFSGQGEGATRYGTALARHFHANLTLLHVNDVYSPALDAFQNLRGPIDTGWVTALELERLREMNSYQEAEFRDLDVQRMVVSGDPARRIAEHARAHQIDLIVMPTHGYGPFRRFLLGSVTAKVLHDVECPVWTGAHMREPPQDWDGVQNVMCAINGGPASERVLRWARDFSSEFEASLTVVHAIPASGPEQSRSMQTDQAREQIQCLAEKLTLQGGIDIEEGAPVSVVTSAAARTKAGVLVIGRSLDTERLGRLRANAYAIIRESPCPVVSV